MEFLFSTRGRITRLQFWLGSIVPIIIWLVAAAVTVALVGTDPASVSPGASLSAFALVAITFIVTVWINLCLAVKRFHDRGKSGWWYLIILVPFIGTLWLLIELGLLAGDYGTNEYGPEPGSASASDLEAELIGLYGGPNGADQPQAASHAHAPAAPRAQPSFQPAAFGRAPARASFGQRGA